MRVDAFSASPSDEADWLEREGFDLSVLHATPQHDLVVEPDFLPDLSSYDQFQVLLSGGKDSLSLLLYLLELGVPAEKIEAHHHLVDGREGSKLMDWPVTESYCAAVCNALGVELTFSWRAGGIEAELLRDNTSTAPAIVPDENGGYRPVGGKGPLGVRRKFPQVSPNLAVRWCSPSAKIGPHCSYLANNARFLGKRTLVLTGERAQESSSRAHYKVFEPHRSDTRNSTRVPRHIDVWRAVHGWNEHRVWDIIKRFRVTPHPCYYLGISRASCRFCVFSSKNQWATVRKMAPEGFEQIARYENEFNVTIHRKLSVVEQADAGTPFDYEQRWAEIANGREFDHPIFMDPWVLPKGAFGEKCGPT